MASVLRPVSDAAEGAEEGAQEGAEEGAEWGEYGLHEASMRLDAWTVGVEGSSSLTSRLYSTWNERVR